MGLVSLNWYGRRVTSTAAFAFFSTGFTLSLSLILAIGAQNAFVLRQGLRREHVAAVVAVCAVLDVSLMAIGVAGLGAAIGSRPALLEVIRHVGAAVLIFYAVQALRRAMSSQALQTSAGGERMPLRQVVAQIAAISLLNPHVYLDTVVLVGAVGAQQPDDLRWVFLCGAGLASTVWFVALGFGARLLTPLFAKPVAWRALDLLVAALMAWIAWGLLVPATA